MGAMIHLDTNILIATVHRGSIIQNIVLQWLKTGKIAVVNAVAWSEFWNGPVTDDQRKMALIVVRGKILHFSRQDAEEAARLFNLTGRRRSSQPDCMIAAAAIVSGSSLATLNERDFIRFVPFGLRLEKIA